MAWSQSSYHADYFIMHLQTIAAHIRDAVRQTMHTNTIARLSQPIDKRGGDTIYQLDLPAEEILQQDCIAWGTERPFLLIAEGLSDGSQIFPAGSDPAHLAFTLIADPIDGTRGLMYGKRSAWVLLGVAPPPRDGQAPRLQDISIALQAELPTTRALLADMLWAVRGEGAAGQTLNLVSGEIQSFVPQPSQASSIMGGFATIAKFFSGFKESAAQLEEHLFAALLGDLAGETPLVFDDEYLSTGGQLYELAIGHDRFIADLRPILAKHDGATRLLCCHPYDICTALIASEAGVVVTDATGQALDAPLDTTSPVAWIGYANEQLQASIAPLLHRLLQEISK